MSVTVFHHLEGENSRFKAELLTIGKETITLEISGGSTSYTAFMSHAQIEQLTGALMRYLMPELVEA